MQDCWFITIKEIVKVIYYSIFPIKNQKFSICIKHIVKKLMNVDSASVIPQPVDLVLA
jgi:hypothetical protein